MPGKTEERLNQIASQIQAHSLDWLALVPGPNLHYLLHLEMIPGERPIVILLGRDATLAAILPQMEARHVQETWPQAQLFTYSDDEGPEPAFRRAGENLPLAQSRIAIEHLRMRVIELRALELAAPACEFHPLETCWPDLRAIKRPEEITAFREAIAITERALEETLPQIRPGMTERQIAGLLRQALLAHGAEGESFPTLVVAGPNSADPHRGPSDHPLEPGEILVIDFGARWKGYHADLTRTFAFGAIDPRLEEAYHIVLQANEAARTAVRPGVTAEEIDHTARQVIEAAGYGPHFIHRTGHGIGLEIHEPPYIVAGNQTVLQPGMVFTIEPGIYLPGIGGVRIEDDVYVTAEGSECLTSYSRELRILSSI